MKTTFCLVYQGGIANVFEEMTITDTRNEDSSGLNKSVQRVRVMQGSFSDCETFCRGLRRAHKIVRVAWCNEAGDITNSFWKFNRFDYAPFNLSFAKDFVDNWCAVW